MKKSEISRTERSDIMYLASSDWWAFLSESKDAFASIQSIGTVVAVAIGGLWALMAFRRRRLRFPRATISHAICAWSVAREKRNVHVTVAVRNDGEVLLKIKDGCMRTYQIDPCPPKIYEAICSGLDPVDTGSTEVDWPYAGPERLFKCEEPLEIEPGESDDFHFDVLIDESIRRILVYTHISNISKRRGLNFWRVRKIGWNLQSFYDIPTQTIKHASQEPHQRQAGVQ